MRALYCVLLLVATAAAVALVVFSPPPAPARLDKEPPKVNVIGSVVNSEGEGQSGVWMNAWYGKGSFKSDTTKTGGKFEFKIEPGTFTLDYLSDIGPIHVGRYVLLKDEVATLPPIMMYEKNQIALDRYDRLTSIERAAAAAMVLGNDGTPKPLREYLMSDEALNQVHSLADMPKEDKLYRLIQATAKSAEETITEYRKR
jgi:hypothetical protein